MNWLERLPPDLCERIFLYVRGDFLSDLMRDLEEYERVRKEDWMYHDYSEEIHNIGRLRFLAEALGLPYEQPVLEYRHWPEVHAVQWGFFLEEGLSFVRTLHGIHNQFGQRWWTVLDGLDLRASHEQMKRAEREMITLGWAGATWVYASTGEIVVFRKLKALAWSDYDDLGFTVF